jgi:hypothetical protein
MDIFENQHQLQYVGFTLNILNEQTVLSVSVDTSTNAFISTHVIHLM